MPYPFPCSPVIPKWFRKKTQIEKIYIYYSVLSFTLPSVFLFTYLILEAATKNYSLKWMFPKTKQNPLKGAGFVKLNSSQLTFKDFF